mmetsp:Transcript_13853/g.46831  ORF Transcript_13853/g.46831 Transcript_13853/m.46831 type:complete len:335 (-) Transcript_13853:146-1150(-)
MAAAAALWLLHAVALAAEAPAPRVNVNGEDLSSVTERTHVVVVEETGTPGDAAAGTCVPHHGVLPPVHALLSCSLHAALAYANQVPGWQDVTVLIAPGHYLLDHPLPRVERDMTITGPSAAWDHALAAPEVSIAVEGATSSFSPRRGGGAYRPVLDGQRKTRLLDVAKDVSLALRHVALVHGRAPVGGAIRQRPRGSGRLELFNVSLRENEAAYGGAIYSESTTVLDSCAASVNEASVCGAAAYAAPRAFSAVRTSFINNVDSCGRRPEGFTLVETVKAPETQDNVIVVGHPVEVSEEEWLRERARLDDKGARRAALRQGGSVAGQPHKPRLGF